MQDFTDAASTRRRVLVTIASLMPLPLRRDVEQIVSPYDRERARDAVDALLESGEIELYDAGSGIRLRLSDVGRSSLIRLPGDDERGAGSPGGRWLPVDRSEAIEPEGTPSSRRVGALRLLRSSDGQATTEYAMLLGFLCIPLAAAGMFLANVLNDFYSRAAVAMDAAPTVETVCDVTLDSYCEPPPLTTETTETIDTTSTTQTTETTTTEPGP